jgi:hypothetical protein
MQNWEYEDYGPEYWENWGQGGEEIQSRIPEEAPPTLEELLMALLGDPSVRTNWEGIPAGMPREFPYDLPGGQSEYWNGPLIGGVG